jgi:hypothetical protein
MIDACIDGNTSYPDTPATLTDIDWQSTLISMVQYPGALDSRVPSDATHLWQSCSCCRQRLLQNGGVHGFLRFASGEIAQVHHRGLAGQGNPGRGY